jgi:hypothetical protein
MTPDINLHGLLDYAKYKVRKENSKEANEKLHGSALLAEIRHYPMLRFTAEDSNAF